MEKPDLILITDMAQNTGTGTYAYDLFDALKRAGKNVAFLYTGYGHLRRDKDIIDYKRVESNGGYISKALAKWINQRQIRKLNIFQENNIHLCGTSYSLSRFHEDAIATVHDLYFIKPQKSQLLDKDIMITYTAYDFAVLKTMSNLKKIKNIISISDETRKQVLSKTNKDSTVIHHWVNKQRFHPRDKVESRKILNLPTNKHIILNVSVNGPNKNLGLLTAIADRLPEDWVLVKVGHPIYLKNVINIGKLEEELYARLFNSADIYLHTSTFEGFGRPLIESMGSGLPIIASNTPSSREVLGKKSTYFDFSESPEDIFFQIQDMISKENYNELVNLSLYRSELFSESKVISQYINFYRKTIGIF
jgi:glycosyltransferase involved in cell wall biosynthesis